MSNCTFELVGNTYRCTRCGLEYPAEWGNKMVSPCAVQGDIEPDRSPSLTTKAVNYTKAVVRHVTSGMETRSQDEIDRIFAICESNKCKEFNGKGCNICGCCVNKSRKALRNKIAMESQHCPKGEW